MNIRISGNLKGPTVILLVGWPDTCDIFHNNLMASLSATHRLVGISLPGFEDDLTFSRQYHARLQRALHCPARGVSREGAANDCAGGTAAGRLDETTGERAAHLFALRASLAGLTPWSVPRTGHSFSDLLALLEIAVDTAMATHNYYHPKNSSPSRSVQPSNNSSCPALVPPDGSAAQRPVLVAHGWGCLLAYELLLCRPLYFSRLVALDVGGAIFEHEAVYRSIQYHRSATSMENPAPRERTSTEGSLRESQGALPQDELAAGGGAAPASSCCGEKHTSQSCAPRPAPPSGVTAGGRTRATLWWWHGLVALLFLCLPGFLANALLRLALWVAGRPAYREAPHHRITEASETFNNRFELHLHYSQHYYGPPPPDAAQCFGTDGSFFDTPPTAPDGRPQTSWEVVLVPFLRTVAHSPTTSSTIRRSRRPTGADVGPSGGSATPAAPQRVSTVLRGYAMAPSGGLQAGRAAAVAGVDAVPEYGNPYYSAYHPTGAGRVFQDPTQKPSSAGGHHSAAYHDTARTLFRKREVVYKPYYLPPAPATREASTPAGPAAYGGLHDRLRVALRRRWREVLELVGGPGDGAARAAPAGPSALGQDSGDAVRPDNRMGWIFLRYASGALLSRLFTPRSNWGQQKRRRRGWWLLTRSRSRSRSQAVAACWSSPSPVQAMHNCDFSMVPSSRHLALHHHHQLVEGILEPGDTRTDGRQQPAAGPLEGATDHPNLRKTNGSSGGSSGAADPLEEGAERLDASFSSRGGKTFVPHQAMHSPLCSQRFFVPIHVPVLFLYGTGKRCMLHSAQWRQYVDWKGTRDGGRSRVVPVEGGGHWFFAEPQCRDAVAAEVVASVNPKFHFFNSFTKTMNEYCSFPFPPSSPIHTERERRFIISRHEEQYEYIQNVVACHNRRFCNTETHPVVPLTPAARRAVS
eukprot:gene11009-7652_t